MAETLESSNTRSRYDHYTRPYDHIMRIDTTLSNTAARLFDAAEMNVGRDHQPRDVGTEHLLKAASSINKLHDEAVCAWAHGAFKDLSVTERLKTGTDLLQAAKNTLSEFETYINKTPGEYGFRHSGAFKVVAAQHARLDGVLEEHRERQQLEKASANIPPELQMSDAAQFPIALAAIAANARPAQVDSGTYQGTVLGVTDSLVLQQITSRTAILHQKQSLSVAPEAGQNASIVYSNGVGTVKARTPAVRESGLGR
jgi:hypothetical protein